MMKISAFGDEIAIDFEDQLRLLQSRHIPLIDIRAAWDINCSLFTAEHIRRINDLCSRCEISVHCMGSPVGKSPIDEPIGFEAERLRAIADTAHQLKAPAIRIFSFYPTAAINQAAIDQAIERLAALTDIAETLDVQLLLENELGLVGERPEHCLRILRAIDSPRLRFIWDPANFVQCGLANHVAIWWEALSPFIGNIHIKDALLPDPSRPAADGGRSQVTLAGHGDGQLKTLLTRLRDSGYDGVLSLEPHLVEARHSSGFSGADGMTAAVSALRKLMTELAIKESR